MIPKILIKRVLVLASFLISFLTYAAKPLVAILPITTNFIQNPNPGHTVIEYAVVNQSSRMHHFVMMPILGVTQNVSHPAHCGNALFPGAPFPLQPNVPCVLSLTVNRSALPPVNGGPMICANTGTRACSLPHPAHSLTVVTLDPNFPYGSPPIGNVCQTQSMYATVETMLGSWAMIQAVQMDKTGAVLPPFMNASNTVYAVGTAAIGNLLGIPNCGGGCNDLNGFCFALKFNTKPTFPYMIFQSVNIGANNNSFDIYMAGGGSGAFPGICEQFWGTGNTVNWSAHISDPQIKTCNKYFNNFSTINAAYSVTYSGVTYTAKNTLIQACNYASAGQTGFNTQGIFSNVSIVPVTCPTSLTRITGLALSPSVTTVGRAPLLQPLRNLSTLTDAAFAASPLPQVTTTQMQDCKTPSSGFCGNILSQTLPNYQASISADLTKPILKAQAQTTYCFNHPGVQFCSWSNGQTSGDSYCNQSADICWSCGDKGQKWCTCNGNMLSGCVAKGFGPGGPTISALTTKEAEDQFSSIKSDE